LSLPLASGELIYVGYKYDFVVLPAGEKMSAGIVINDVTHVNVTAQKCLIEASLNYQNL